VRQTQISVVRATTYKMVIVQDIVKILVGHIIIFSNVPVAVIRVAVGNICSMRIPKINGDEIVFESVFFIGITESVTKITLRRTQKLSSELVSKNL
jgi:hypothetical protein